MAGDQELGGKGNQLWNQWGNWSYCAWRLGLRKLRRKMGRCVRKEQEDWADVSGEDLGRREKCLSSLKHDVLSVLTLHPTHLQSPNIPV